MQCAFTGVNQANTRMHSFRLSSLGEFFILLLCTKDIHRYESYETNLENEPDTKDNASSSTLSQKVNEEGDSNSGSDDASEDEPEDLYFYFFDNESIVTEYEALPNDDAKDEPDFLYHPQSGHIRIVEFYAQ